MMSLFLLPSCSESDDTVEEYPNWKATNEAYWNNLYTTTETAIANGDTSWKILRKWSLEDSLKVDNSNFVVVHVDKQGTGAPLTNNTDSAVVYYEGRLLPSVSYPSGYVFDSKMPPTQLPVTFYTGSLVDGFTTALLNMHKGDSWTVYMPYQLGYGTTGSSSSIPGYSVLTFKIQLVDFK